MTSSNLRLRSARSRRISRISRQLPAMKHWRIALSALLLCASAAVAQAAAGATPVGDWKTIDDKSGQPKALIRIVEKDGALSGRIVELYQPSRPDPVCDKCEGARKGQPITGMEILWGARKDGERWTGGHILDPETGTIYRLELRLSEDGNQLKARGYVGVSLLGRTQQWQRQVITPVE